MAVTAPASGFDTLSYARRLKAAGVDEAQAEAHAEADLESFEARIEKIFADFESRLVRSILAIAAGQTALIVGLLKLLP